MKHKSIYEDYFINGGITQFSANHFQYSIPTSITRNVIWLNKYFKSQDEAVEEKCRGRKSNEEWLGLAVLILNRIHTYTSRGNCIVAGSKFICGISWAVFGDSMRSSQHYFKDITDIADYYIDFLCGPCHPHTIKFNKFPGLTRKIAKDFAKPPHCSANFWMAVSILLLHDIVIHCGPDTVEFFEVFTNDVRETPEKINTKSWWVRRGKALGLPDMEAYQSKVFVASPPAKPTRTITKITELNSSQNLAEGEKTTLTVLPYYNPS